MLPAAQEVRDSSSGVTPCIVMKNDRILYQVSSFSSESMRIRISSPKVKEPLPGILYITRDELIRAIERSMRNINKDGHADGERRLPNIWQKVINERGDYIQDI